MSSSSVCRVCLAGGTGEVVLHTVNNQLLEVYEKLTNAKVDPDNAKLCFICQAQLQKCYRFTNMARRSEQYLKTVLETDIKAKEETVSNLLKLVKLQTLSVTTLKPIYFDGQRKRPKKSLKDKELVSNESTVKIDSIDNLVENDTEIEIVRNDTVIKKINSFGTDRFENEIVNENIDKNETKGEFTNEMPLVSNANLTVEAKNENKSNESLIENKKGFKTKKIITEEGRIEEEVEIVINELNYQSNPEGIHENITQVKDYVVINDTELLYECDICHGTYPTRAELATHQSTHRTEKKQKYNIDEIIKNLPKTKQPYCPICKKFFAGYTSQLIEHLKIHTGERPFICDTCGKSSRTKHHLLEHIRTHTKEKVFCKICDKSFTQMSSLGKHMLSHTGMYPHFCHLCGKKFTQSGQLKMHIRAVHEGIKPHACEVCGKRFSGKSECKRHVEAHAGRKLFSCDKCGTLFSTNTTLNRHQKKNCKMA